MVSNTDAEIIEIVKMLGPGSKDKSFENTNNNININKLPDGIYKVRIRREEKDNVQKKKNKNKSYYLIVEKKKLVRQTSKYPKPLSGAVQSFKDEIYRHNKIRIPEADWIKLIAFYIVQNPSMDINKNFVTAQYFDIKKHWGDNCWQRGDTLRTSLITTLPNYQYIVKKVDTSNNMKKPLKELKLDRIEDINMETKVCIVDSCSNIFLSIFRHIRNGLAHGRFKFYEFKGKYFLFIEDTYKGSVTARMIFEVSILLHWIDLIKMRIKSESGFN